MKRSIENQNWDGKTTPNRDAGLFTLQPVTESSNSNLIPEFGRWQDVQRLFGIKRGTLYNLWAEGKIKSASVRRRGNKCGCRLFYLPGISEYLKSLMQQPNGGARE